MTAGSDSDPAETTGNPDPDLLAARAAVERLQESGHTAYWAGGCVRDRLLDRRPKDYDIATDATPDDISELFPHSILVGKSFGVVRAPVEDTYLEIATFRRDSVYLDGRRPESVTFTTPREDARRRDFTINAMFYDPVAGVLHDFVDGRADLEAGIVRCVGDPARRFAEDHLRMLRAIRFAATLGFRIAEETAEAIRANAQSIIRISQERVRDELTRILCEAAKPGEALATLERLGLLRVILPEVSAMVGQEQPPQFHPEGDVFTHTVLMLDMMSPARDPRLAYAVLLHDVGKPVTADSSTDRIRFNGHASEGATMSKAILRRLRLRTDDITFVSACIHNHMRFMHVRQMRQATLRKLVGAETFPVELELHRLDCMASHRKMHNYDFLQEYLLELETESEEALPDAWIRGGDMLATGVPQGPQVGRWLKTAYDAQLEGGFEGREQLLRWLRRQIAESEEGNRRTPSSE
jgi:tRNA nucleotidyltransferase/poly(A) polymerase